MDNSSKAKISEEKNNRKLAEPSHSSMATQGASMSRASGDLLIAIGRITRSHGVHGDAKVTPFFDDVLEPLTGRTVTIAPEKKDLSPFTATIESIRGGGKALVVSFDTLHSPEVVSRIAPALIQTPKNSLPPMPEGRYFFEEIIGLPVESPDGERLGDLTDFFPAGEKDVWVITKPDGGEILTPCTPDTLKEIDLAKGLIVMNPLEDL